MIKHTVTTDALLTLGTILPDDHQGRDAIHIAVISAKANEWLEPGQQVVICDDVAYPETRESSIGIVDPFLPETVTTGQRFWVLLHPRTITSLRHVWSHPALPDEPSVQPITPDARESALGAIRAVAQDLGVSVERMMEGADEWLQSGGSHKGYMHFGNDLSYNWNMPAFWDAYALLTGKHVPEDMRQSFFSCAC